MNGYSFTLAGTNLEARASGALFWPERKLLCVSDLHLGKSEVRSQKTEVRKNGRHTGMIRFGAVQQKIRGRQNSDLNGKPI